jgi:hypothetical protein
MSCGHCQVLTVNALDRLGYDELPVHFGVQVQFKEEAGVLCKDHGPIAIKFVA